MSEPITLEFLSAQCDRILAEIEATREIVRETTEIVRRCVAKGEEIQRLMDEFLSVACESECD